MDEQEKREFADGIKQALKDAGYEYNDDDNGDSVDDLDNEELETLMNQIAEKTTRPRHTIGLI